ncbi:hypothetical protein [Streptomyces sp. NPDC055210]
MKSAENTDVCLVLTVDLTGTFHSSREVSAALREQTSRNVDCHTAVVRLGADAVRHHLGLGSQIAGALFLSAQRIEVHAPAGNIMGALLYDEVARYVRLYVDDHARMKAKATPGSCAPEDPPA